LGACNPELAHRTLQKEPQIGLLLPCNVVVRVDRGAVRIGFMDPTAVLGLIDRPGVRPVAADIKQRLQRVSRAVAAIV
jgi:uncharacterized protein (DUF302 family)